MAKKVVNSRRGGVMGNYYTYGEIIRELV